jgi:2-C-methyl-D-erythritol 4-phosphate cytidylyltransferase
MKACAILVAAGRGTRAGGALPKQWRALDGKPVIAHTLAAFADHPGILSIVIVAHPDDIAAGLTASLAGVRIMPGGATRSASVQAGLAACDGQTTHVLIHDAARPCVTRAVIDGVLEALETHEAAAPAVAVVDALWTGAGGQVTGVVDRTGLFRAQTPQGFALGAIRAAHARFPEGADDDVALARQAGHTVAITPGCEDNIKITTPQDFARAERILRSAHGHQTG